ncbi:DUF3343 domain-containing protein [Oceanirhabdus sp. W0125-5]|uniref:DUF3343 domain-containing protein n=1 Tax=Oceanirhabdus sp. W0125-5 TaxID=2999116 RepID=UPI0022F32F90|nr:DUF3343 domain-containing protein [Oceanirhabdus sp. W0125-5]WBW96711.1 DUF3343 domain-containing protein [Oceanirhabdus sp. W0125-5]
MKYYILFDSHTDGLKVESYLKKEGIKYTISPTPRQLSTCCGISIMYDIEDENRIKSIVQDNNLKVKGFYSLERTVKNFYT